MSDSKLVRNCHDRAALPHNSTIIHRFFSFKYIVYHSLFNVKFSFSSRIDNFLYNMLFVFLGTWKGLPAGQEVGHLPLQDFRDNFAASGCQSLNQLPGSQSAT